MLWELILAAVILWGLRFRLQKMHLVKCAKQFDNDIRSLPIIGHAYAWFGTGEDVLKAFQKHGLEALNHGGITASWLGYNLYIIVAEPESAEWALVTCLEKDDAFRVCRALTGEMIAFAPVPIWRNRRRLFTPAFSPLNLSRYVNVFARHAQNMTHRLQGAADHGTKALYSYLAYYSMDSIFETTFGLSLSSEAHDEFSSAIEPLGELFAARITKPWLYNDTVYKMLPAYSTFIRHKNALYAAFNGIIDTKRRDMADGPKHKSLNNLVENLIECVESDIEDFTKTDLQGELVGLLLVGTETSATTLGFTLHMLAAHPEVQEKVFEEVAEVMGSSQIVTTEHLSSFRYLEATIKETLRLLPLGPVITRKVDRDVTMPDGRVLVRGSNILINIWALHRNPVYWGQDADQFRPERFLEGSLRNPAQFMPFSLGPRNCIVSLWGKDVGWGEGRVLWHETKASFCHPRTSPLPASVPLRRGYKYAMLSMKTALATIIRRYSVNLGPESGLVISFNVVAKDVNKVMLDLVTRT